jgi:hypothetical protein
MKKFISILIVSSLLMVTCVWAEDNIPQKEKGWYGYIDYIGGSLGGYNNDSKIDPYYDISLLRAGFGYKNFLIGTKLVQLQKSLDRVGPEENLIKYIPLCFSLILFREVDQEGKMKILRIYIETDNRFLIRPSDNSEVSDRLVTTTLGSAFLGDLLVSYPISHIIYLYQGKKPSYSIFNKYALIGAGVCGLLGFYSSLTSSAREFGLTGELLDIGLGLKPFADTPVEFTTGIKNQYISNKNKTESEVKEYPEEKSQQVYLNISIWFPHKFR